VLDATRFSPECLIGLSEFSHVELLFPLHNVPESTRWSSITVAWVS
jgi:tRNA (Thr-GGU) A37 N-methylase